MNKRRASRELALMAFSHLGKNIKKSEDVEILSIIAKTVDSLTTEGESNLDTAVKELVKVREYVYNYEIEHETNIERSFDISTIPVKIPMTSDMLGRIDMVLDSAEKTYAAIDLVKLATLGELDEVKDYAVRLIKTYVDNKEEIDDKIKEHSKGWDVERLVKIDRDILRIALVEMLFFEDVPKGVSIDEAVELAKKYSTEESSKFINGILGQVAIV